VFFTDEGGQTKLADAAATAAADKSADGRPIDMLEPGMIQRLPPATDVKFASPPMTAGYPDYVRAQLRRVAVGYGVPYETLAGDLSQVNFSSGRMGWIEFQRSVDQWRWHMLIPHLCEPIGRWFCEAATPALNMRSDFSLSWTPPRREMIDPAKEIAASRDSVRAGLSSRSEELRKLGYDPDKVEADLAAENKRADALGLKFDSDGRFPMNAPVPGAGDPTLKTDARSDNVAD
jgi:lambda family phage portal protein